MGKKKKVGRPSSYKKEYCLELMECMQQGYSYEAFAGKIGHCKDTLYEWEKKHPEFADAKKRGVSMGQYKWETMALDCIHDPATLNTALWIFNMKNRFGWRDQVEIEARSTQTLIVETASGKKDYFAI